MNSMAKFVSVASWFRTICRLLTRRNLTEQFSQDIIIFNLNYISIFLRRHVPKHTLDIPFLLVLLLPSFSRASHVIMPLFPCFLNAFFVQIIIKDFPSVFDITAFSFNFLIQYFYIYISFYIFEANFNSSVILMKCFSSELLLEHNPFKSASMIL